MHIIGVHEDKKDFVCSICSLGFSIKGNLNWHVRTVHEKVKPFKCTECESSCASKSDLKKRAIRAFQESLTPCCTSGGNEVEILKMCKWNSFSTLYLLDLIKITQFRNFNPSFL